VAEGMSQPWPRRRNLAVAAGRRLAVGRAKLGSGGGRGACGGGGRGAWRCPLGRVWAVAVEAGRGFGGWGEALPWVRRVLAVVA